MLWKQRKRHERLYYGTGALAFIILLMLSLFMPLTGVNAGSSVDWNIQIPGENPEFDANNTPVMIAGIEHNLSFYIGNSDAVNVSLTYAGDIAQKNQTNTYEWRYAVGSFSDVLYGTYINLTSSSVFSDKVAFHIGVHAKVKYGIWHLVVQRKLGSRYERIIDSDIHMEKADPRLALSTPVFEFRVEPFESGEMISPTEKDYRFTTINSGNVPLWLECSYDSMSEIFYTTNMSLVLHPGASLKHSIYLTSLPWSPRVFTVKEYVKGTAMHMITSDMVSFIPSFQTVVKINVKVVRQGFNIMDIGLAKLQYEKGPKVADFNDVLDLHLFISGHSDASLTVSVRKLELLGIYYDGRWHNESDTSETLTFHLTNDSDEKEIMVRVRCYREDVSDARVTYQLYSDSNSGSVYTDIVVGKAPYVPQAPQKSSGINIVAIVGVLVVIAVILIFMFFYTKKLKEEGDRK